MKYEVASLLGVWIKLLCGMSRELAATKSIWMLRSFLAWQLWGLLVSWCQKSVSNAFIKSCSQVGVSLETQHIIKVEDCWYIARNSMSFHVSTLFTSIQIVHRLVTPISSSLSKFHNSFLYAFDEAQNGSMIGLWEFVLANWRGLYDYWGNQLCDEARGDNWRSNKALGDRG